MDWKSSSLEKLRDIGFTINEAKVYLTLIKLGTSKAGTIAKYAELDRSSMYNALQSLLKKGLASYALIGRTRWFQSSNTSNIIDYLSSKVDLAKQFLPELEKVRKYTKPKENVRLFKGNRGIQTIYQDILDHADESLIFGSEGHFSERMPAFAVRFVKQMENRGIKVKSITRASRAHQDHLHQKKEERKIPSLTISPVVTTIYSDKIAIIIWSEVPEGILIQNKQASDAYREYFNFIWRYARK